jgi:hypothetical protein
MVQLSLNVTLLMDTTEFIRFFMVPVMQDLTFWMQFGNSIRQCADMLYMVHAAVGTHSNFAYSRTHFVGRCAFMTW